MSEFVPLDGLVGAGLGLVLSYPRLDPLLVERRVLEMGALGVEGVLLRGRSRMGDVPVLGRGHVGVVVAARYRGEEVALKVRRVDADRPSLEEEASHLRLANGVGVGPVYLGGSGDLLLMELIEGEYLVEWAAGLGAQDGGLVRGVLGGLLERAWRLDDLGLDHGELSRARRHVIVSGGVARIIDFESASTGRRCSNLTSIVQYLFFSGGMAGALRRVLPAPDRGVLLGALRAYKRGPSEGGLRGVLGACGLLA